MGEINFTATDVIDHVRIYKKSFSQKKKDPDTEVYYPDELEILKSYCLSHPNPYTRCIVAAIVLWERIGECAPLKIADVDLEGRYVCVQRIETRADSKGKATETIREGSKTEAGVRKVAIPESAIVWFEEIVQIAKPSGSEYLFPQEAKTLGKKTHSNRQAGQRIRSQQLRRNMMQYCKEAGIPYKPPHKLRKTYASILKGNDVSDAVITAQMGHTDIKTTNDYYVRSRQRMKERAVMLGKIDEFKIELIRDKE